MKYEDNGDTNGSRFTLESFQRREKENEENGDQRKDRDRLFF